MEKQVNRYSAITLALNAIFLRGKTEIRGKNTNKNTNKILLCVHRFLLAIFLNMRSGSFVLDAFEEMSNGSIT